MGNDARRHESVGGGQKLPDRDYVVESTTGSESNERYESRFRGQNPVEVEGYGADGGPSLVDEDHADRHVDREESGRIEMVIGVDDRVRVRNTAAFPWRTICSLRMEAGDGSRFIGSGVLVGPRTVVTAGHCVYFHRHGGFAKEIEVIPGRDGGVRPFGAVFASRFYTVRGWVDERLSDFDYGAVLLPTDLGERVGTMGFASLATGTLRNLMVNNAGYPGDRPGAAEPGDPPTGTTMWWNASQVAEVTDSKIGYTLDTFGGQSGSPVWRYVSSSGQRAIVGLHTTGDARANSATRINDSVFENISRWIQAD